MNENSLIKDIGRSYIVSSFIPAALFMAMAALIFKDFVPSFLLRRIISSDELNALQWVILILLNAWLGFALYSGWNSTVRLFEGYYFPNNLKSSLTKRIKKVYMSKRELIDEYKRFDSLQEPTPEDIRRRDELQPSLISLFQDLEMNFPVEGQLLPTRLGNILRAAERYPFDRYRIEAITIFPRLVHLLPPEFSNQLEESNNKFIFLLNSSLLAFMIGFGAALASILRFPCYAFREDFMREGIFSIYGRFACTYAQTPANFFQAGFQRLNEWKYLFLGFAFIALGYVLYRIAAVMARAYANLIRSCYDIYRYELLKNLNIPFTNDFDEEKAIWLNLTNFYNNGGYFGKKALVPDFKPKGEKDENTDSSPKSFHLDITLQNKLLKKRNRLP